MNKFTAVDPNGTVHTRNSKTRTYTHTVVALPSSLASTMAAMSTAARKMHRSNFKYHMAFVDGTSQWLQRNTFETEVQYLERSAMEIERSAVELEGCDNAEDYVNMKIVQAYRGIREAMARGYYDTYQNLGWCGRADLAAKLKATSEARSWVSVTILVAE